MAIGKHRGIHRAGRRARNAVDSKPRLLEQTIKHAPRECPMRASALQVNGAVWQAVGTATTDSNGLGEFTDTNPPAVQGYYRTVSQ